MSSTGSGLLVPPPGASRPLWLQLLEQKENLALEVQQLSQDCKMQQQKNAGIQAQLRELLSERDQVGGAERAAGARQPLTRPFRPTCPETRPRP